MSEMLPGDYAPAIAAFGTTSVAMVTAFTEDGALDKASTAAVAAHLVDSGCDSLVVNGTTGESATTSDEEKADIVRTVVEAVGGRARVIAGVGTFDTRHSVHLAAEAEKAGATGLLVVTPYYSKPPQAGLVAHFEAVADATGLPVMLYDIPGRSGVPIQTDTLVRLAEHPRILAVKDAKGDLLQSSWVMRRSGLAYYSGEDALNFALLAHGAVGVVSVVGHVASGDYSRMVKAVAAGDLATARAIHMKLLPVVRAVMERTQGAIAAKAALQAAKVLANRTMRSPLIEATDEEMAILTHDLTENGYL